MENKLAKEQMKMLQNYYESIRSKQNFTSLLSSSENIFNILSFSHIEVVINYLFETFSQEIFDPNNSFRDFIYSKYYLNSKIHIEVILLLIVFGTHEVNSRDKIEFFEYMTCIFCIKTNFDIDSFQKNLKSFLHWDNPYNCEFTILESVKNINFQICFVQNYLKNYLDESDFYFSIIIIKYIKIIVRLLYICSFKIEEISKNSLVYVLYKICFFNRFELINYSLDFIKFVLESNFDLILDENSKLTQNQTELIQLFASTFSIDQIEYILQLEETGLNCKNSEIKYTYLNSFIDFFTNDENHEFKLFTRDICCLYLVFIYRSKCYIINKPEFNPNIDSKKKLFEFSNFSTAFYSNFNIQDIYIFFESNLGKIQMNNKFNVNLHNLLQSLVSEIMKFCQPSISFQRNSGKLSKEYLNFQDLEFRHIQEISNSNYISIRTIKKIIFLIINNYFQKEEFELQEYYLKLWKKFFYKNPITVSKITLLCLSERNLEYLNIEVRLKKMNFYNISQIIDDIYRNRLEIISNDYFITYIINESHKILLYLFYSDYNYNKHYLLLKFGDSVESFLVKYNSDLVLGLYKLKKINKKVYKERLKNQIDSFFHGIFTSNIETINYLIMNLFDEKIIKFLIKNIDSFHVSFGCSEILISSNDPIKIINGLLLLGYWSINYPLSYTFNKVLDIIFRMQKFDLRKILINEDIVSKFLKSFYLMVKAYPKISNEILVFLYSIKNNVNNIGNESSMPSSTLKKMIEKSIGFIENLLVNNPKYNNNQTSNVIITI